MKTILIILAVVVAAAAAWHFLGNRAYVGTSADECARIRFTCDEGTEYFADDAGCGCQPAGQE
jgi:hypothetical protein